MAPNIEIDIINENLVDLEEFIEILESKGETLLKIMITMKNKYGVRFIICPRREMGKKILELLGGKND